MAVNGAQVISLSGLLDFFRDEKNSIDKGEIKFNSNYVLEVRINGFEIKALVRASMKNKSYKVGLVITGDGSISSGSCECPRGNFLCSHMAATAIYVNKKGMSKTDLPNSWIARPKTGSKQATKSMAELFPLTRPNYRATPRAVNQEDRDFFGKLLRDENVDCPFKWILGPEPSKETPDKRAPSLISDLMPLFATDRQAFLLAAQVTREQVQYVAEVTKEQRNCHLWGQYRRMRLTGSNFGIVLTAVKNNRDKGRPFPPSLFKTLRGEYNLSLCTKDSILWGQMHEQQALDQYKEITGNEVASTGLQLFTCGFLGSSPDGVIFDPKNRDQPGALEIKCPWKHRNATIDELLSTEMVSAAQFKKFYLTEAKTLNPAHNYWHQVQAEMVALDVLWAHFVVWTIKDMLIVHVSRDPEWQEQNVPLLSDFYLNQLLPTC